MNGRLAGEMTAGAKNRSKKGSKGSKPDWKNDTDKRSNGSKGKRQGQERSPKEQEHDGVNCPYKWANSIDGNGNGFSWRSRGYDQAD